MLTEWLNYLEKQVGRSVYVWGAQGQRATEINNVREWIFRRSKTDDMAARAWEFYQETEKSIGRENVVFFDCSGLAMHFFQNLKGVAKSDATAHGIWGGCTRIGKGEIRPGDFAFKQTNGRMTHIGYVAADGNIIEARASGYGVEKRKPSAGGWTHFGRHKWLREEIEGSPPTTSSSPPLSCGQGEAGGTAGASPCPTPGEAQGGAKILRCQKLLLMWDPDCLPRYGADGKYGGETDGAVRNFLKWIEDIRRAVNYAGE